MYDIYPAGRALKTRFMHLNGQHFGIMESQILTTLQGRYSPAIRVCTANMPAYQKMTIGEEAEINHHLSGYGMYFEEALIRLLGEGIERYALMNADTLFSEKQFRASFREVQEMGDVMPWEYINMYSEDDYMKLEGVTNVRQISMDDKLTWIEAASIFDTERKVYIPVQLLVTGFRGLTDEILFAPGFSKGTAAHSSVERALKSALLEAVEADAFTTGWYTKRYIREIIIDDMELIDMMLELTGRSGLTANAYDISAPGMPGHSVITVLLAEKGRRPAVIVGCQCDLDAGKAVYKAFQEALAVYYLAVNGPLLIPELYLKKVRDNGFNNLDSNVAFWSDNEGWKWKREFFKDWCSGQVLLSSLKSEETGDDVSDIAGILKKLKSVSEYGVYLDLTPPELAGRGWHVMRVFFPELVQMCLPAYPYSAHPRMIQMGGVKNELPHPVP